MKLLSIGHSTFKLDLDGQVILTDPWFTASGFVYHFLTRRIFPPALKPSSIEKCDALLVSHSHMDHLCHEAFTTACRLDSLIIGPRSVIRRAKRHNVPNVHEVKAGEKIELGKLKITAVPASHPLASDAIGFLLEGEKNLYFSGDTRFDWSIVNWLRGKRIDLALLQVSCAFYPWLNGADGMDTNYAVEFAKAIRPRCVVPMHFDCVGKYLDIVAGVRVSERNLDVEEVLARFERHLVTYGIDCAILYAGKVFEM
jgi:L-ascorbate metabolism protein UlaG (beta-lactamase superfamily)